MPNVPVSDENLRWLESLGKPFGETPDDVVTRLRLRYTGRQQGALGETPSTAADSHSKDPTPVEALTEDFVRKVISDVKERTGSLSVRAWWQPKGKRYSVGDRKRFGTIVPFQPRNRRIIVAVPQHLVERAQIPVDTFDERVPKAWYGLYDSFRVFVPLSGGTWDAAKYEQAVDILARVWQVH